MAENQHTAVRLMELIAAKLQVVELLAGLAQRQLQLAEAGEMGPLLKLLAAKQTVLDQLQRLERGLDPFRGQNPDERVWRDPASRERCQEQVNRASQLLAEAMSLDKRSEAAMLKRRQAAAAALEEVQSAAAAHAAYAAPDPAAASTIHCEG
jgi:hypothetical protein